VSAPKTVAVIPTINTLGWTATLAEHLLLCDEVDEVRLYDAGTDGTEAWALHRRLTDKRLMWIDNRGRGIHETWNSVIREHGDEPTNVAILNSDIRLPPDGVRTLCEVMRAGGYQFAAVDATRPALYSQHHRWWHPDLHALTEPVAPHAVPLLETDVIGWAFVVAAEFWRDELYAVHPRLEWWYGDDDLMRRLYARGGRACTVRGVGCDHLGSGSDASNHDKAEKIARDQARFAELWPTTRLIYGEEPSEHWAGVEVRDRVVLDLGAGDFGVNRLRPYPATADHWLSEGASRVLAVDMRAEDLERYDDPRITPIVAEISTSADLEKMVLVHRPQVIKCDLEGGEAHLLAMSPQLFAVPEAYAIETHTIELYERALAALERHGYATVWTGQMTVNPDIRVIYARRTSNK
jgi:GT2 family glycosyltransferase